VLINGKRQCIVIQVIQLMVKTLPECLLVGDDSTMYSARNADATNIHQQDQEYFGKMRQLTM